MMRINRNNDPILGSIAPDEFILIAEKNGLVVRIDCLYLGYLDRRTDETIGSAWCKVFIG